MLIKHPLNPYKSTHWRDPQHLPFAGPTCQVLRHTWRPKLHPPFQPRRLGLGPGDVCWEQLGMGPSGSYDLGYLVGFWSTTNLGCYSNMSADLWLLHGAHVENWACFKRLCWDVVGYLGSGKSGFQWFYFHSIPVMHEKYVKLVNGDHWLTFAGEMRMFPTWFDALPSG